MESKSIDKNEYEISKSNIGDKFRKSLHLEHPTVEWRYGKPPIYESANQLFEQGRTKVCIQFYLLCIFNYLMCLINLSFVL